MYEILIVDDDTQIVDVVELILKREGYHVMRAHSAREASQLVDITIPDLIIIDTMLPDMDGVSLCRTLRERTYTAHTPILFLTGLRTTNNVVDAFNSGADDYIRKPFQARELAARVRAHLRRSIYYGATDISVMRIDEDAHRVFINEHEITLTPVEYELLRHLCRAPFRLHTAEDLLTGVWRYPNGVGDAALVRNHIRNLRRKIESDPERPLILQSRHGRGYVIKAHIQLDGASEVQVQAL
ncbi:MAG: response regulator transcription factor [Chloroflexota bacterium]|nr:response regulator transcription factor [Chloroflexota bacterium]